MFVLNSAQSSGIKNNWKCDNQELFERKLVVYFVLDYSRKRFFRKVFDLESYFVAYGNLTRLSFLSSRTHLNRKGFLICQIANILSVSLEKVAFMNSSCCIIFELNKFAYVR